MSDVAERTTDDLERLQTMLAQAETEEQIAELERQVAVFCGQTVGTLAEVAAMLGVGISTLWLWRSGADPMPGCEGHWNLRDIQEWREQREAKRNGGDEESAERIAVEVEALKAAIELSECKLAEMTASLITKTSALRGLNEFQAAVEEILAPIPGILTNLAPEDVQREIGTTATQQVDLILGFVKQKFAELRAAVS